MQVKIDEECSKYLTINKHKGLFKLNWLPFGLKVVPSLFQQIMDTMLVGLEFAIAYLDDILVKSKNMDEHKKHIRAIFKRIEELEFKVNPKNVRFFMEKTLAYLVWNLLCKVMFSGHE